MALNRFEGDLYVTGNIGSATLSIPAGTLINAGVNASADISATKLEMQHSVTYGQNGTASSVTVPIHCVRNASGAVVSIEAGSVVANIGAATVTVDLKKNGTTMLTGVITLDNANTAYLSEAGTLSSTALVDGDVLTLVIVATAGGGTLATGLFVTVYWSEKTS